ncbi:MAG: hypothetical protein H6707_05115 [Deltaproteobacteria bacterium]|nr:hypothetical protein [Deltaproteobacteria bacterium]
MARVHTPATLIAILLALQAGCKTDQPTRRELSTPAATTRPTPKPAAGSGQPQAKQQDPCVRLRQEFAKLTREAAPCHADNDCRCHPPAIDCQSTATTTANASRMTTLLALMRLASCQLPKCAPSVCAARCRRGQCVASSAV